MKRNPLPRCRVAATLLAVSLAAACSDSSSPTSPTPPAATTNVLSFTGHALDFVTRGQSRRVDTTTHRFTGFYDPGSGQVSIQVTAASRDLIDDWSLLLSAGAGRSLVPGRYVRVAATAGNGSTNPVLAFGGQSRGCGSTGEFDVLEAQFNADGSIGRFRATFSQRCESNTPAPTPTTGEISVAGIPRS